jgi:hypothetical protein
MISRHIKSPLKPFHLETRLIPLHKKRRDALRIPGFPACAGKNQTMRCAMHARYPHLFAVDQPSRNTVFSVWDCGGGHMGGVAPVGGLSETECEESFASKSVVDEFLFLFWVEI